MICRFCRHAKHMLNTVLKRWKRNSSFFQKLSSRNQLKFTLFLDFIPLCVQTLLWFAKADLRWHSTSVSIFCPFSTEWLILFLKKFWRNSSFFFFFFGDFEPTRTSNVKSKQTLCFPNISILNYIIFILNGLIFCSIFVYYLFLSKSIELDDWWMLLPNIVVT